MLSLKVMATQTLRNKKKIAEDNVQMFCPQVCSWLFNVKLSGATPGSMRFFTNP